MEEAGIDRKCARANMTMRPVFKVDVTRRTGKIATKDLEDLREKK